MIRIALLLAAAALSGLFPARAGAFPFSFMESEEDQAGEELSMTGEPEGPRRFWRALFEQVFLNGLGEAQYWIRQDANIPDWKYQPTAEGFEKKFTDGWVWDTNTFRTNTVYHSYSGALYYQIGRANGFGPVGSTAWAFTGSLMWEYFGEYREQVSTNDMIVTGVGGSILGEGLRQASLAIERRSPHNPAATVFVYLFDPFRKLNDYLDRKFTPKRYRVRLTLIGANFPVQAAGDRLASRGRHR
ncbi:MAG: DUF3943 domain-containing protein [Nitrospirae bacterium]|nr:DUF3943 domain-containing protein [Nitrospirota bacterium]